VNPIFISQYNVPIERAMNLAINQSNYYHIDLWRLSLWAIGLQFQVDSNLRDNIS